MGTPFSQKLQNRQKISAHWMSVFGKTRRLLEIHTCSSIHDLWGKLRVFFLRNEWNPNDSWILEIGTVLIPFTSLSQKFQEIEDILPHTTESFQQNSEKKMASKLHEKQKIYTGTPSKYAKKNWPHVEHFVLEIK